MGLRAVGGEEEKGEGEGREGCSLLAMHGMVTVDRALVANAINLCRFPRRRGLTNSLHCERETRRDSQTCRPCFRPPPTTPYILHLQLAKQPKSSLYAVCSVVYWSDFTLSVLACMPFLQISPLITERNESNGSKNPGNVSTGIAGQMPRCCEVTCPAFVTTGWRRVVTSSEGVDTERCYFRYAKTWWPAR